MIEIKMNELMNKLYAPLCNSNKTIKKIRLIFLIQIVK